MKKNNSIIYIIAFTLFLLFVGAPFFNWIATNRWQWQFIDENNYDAWIGYYGAIIGGALTLLGVWWTINEQQKQFEKNFKEQQKIADDTLTESKRQFEIELQKKNDELNLLKQQRKEDLSLLYQPILSVDIVKKKPIKKLSKELFLLFKHPTVICQGYNFIPFLLRIKNIGRGEIRELTAYVFNCKIVSSSLPNQDEYDFSSSYILGNTFYSFIPINEERYLHISIPNFASSTDEDFFVRLMVELKITIVGFIEDYEYEYYVKFFLYIENNENGAIIEHDSLSIMYIGRTEL